MISVSQNLFQSLKSFKPIKNGTTAISYDISVFKLKLKKKIIRWYDLTPNAHTT